MNFHKTHANYPPIHETKPITINDLVVINKKFMGGGMSQSYSAIYIIEHYIHLHKFNYVVEIGSQKGALSTYLANNASISEQFIFETYDIQTKDWFCREYEGCGHWFHKLETISPYIKFFKLDIFSEEAMTHIKENIGLYKTLIICDGGNKAKEFNTYHKFLKKDDRIIVHDWPAEINMRNISLDNTIQVDNPWDQYCQSLGSLLMPFRKV